MMRAIGIIIIVEAAPTGYKVKISGSLLPPDESASGAISVDVEVPYSLRFKKADDFIRQQFAAALVPYGVIDPDDIYFPMTN